MNTLTGKPKAKSQPLRARKTRRRKVLRAGLDVLMVLGGAALDAEARVGNDAAAVYFAAFDGFISVRIGNKIAREHTISTRAAAKRGIGSCDLSAAFSNNITSISGLGCASFTVRH